ncbi:M23 family metallopeptidase [Candidatus Uhrbacteria bacterium]|nr:M23 family metallopeptidase [Candidatus Uhrbacteria bacterium]
MLTQKIKHILAKIALATLRGLSAFRRQIGRAWKPVQPIAATLGRISMRFVLLPIYRLLTFLRMRFGKLLSSVRGVAFVFVSNRYVFHAVVAGVGIVTIATQFQAKSATALDAGQRSLLYSIVSDGRETLVEEDVQPELATKDARYLGAETIEALPSIDFDYSESLDPPIADLTVPGSIAALPGSEHPGEPSEVIVARTKTETYAVENGDTISTIARRFGVNVGTVLWANNLTIRSTIRPGSSLKIPPVSGVLHTIKKGDTLQKIALTYKVSTDQVSAFNNLSNGATLSVGEEIMIPDGVPPEINTPIAIRKPTTGNVRPDVPIARIANKAIDVYQELTGKQDTRAKPTDETAAEDKAKTKFLWPTRQHIINQYYGWKHTGMDIEGDYVDPIYASADGVVETAGWNSGGYGLQIIINHGNGNKTRYAHSSKMFVKVGDTVKRGQVIAMVGTTGRSTGTHLHFELYIANKRVNPLPYIR